jgi:hypothetical protein
MNKPPQNKPVLVLVQVSEKRREWIIAEYVEPFTEKYEDYEFDGSRDVESDVKDGVEYVPEGWYESCHTKNELNHIDDPVLDWVELPPKPKKETKK